MKMRYWRTSLPPAGAFPLSYLTRQFGNSLDQNCCQLSGGEDCIVGLVESAVARNFLQKIIHQIQGEIERRIYLDFWFVFALALCNLPLCTTLHLVLNVEVMNQIFRHVPVDSVGKLLSFLKFRELEQLEPQPFNYHRVLYL